MKRFGARGCLAVLALGTADFAPSGSATPIVAHLAFRAALLDARAAKLHAAWLAQHPGAAMPQATSLSIVSGKILISSVVATRAPGVPKLSFTFSGPASSGNLAFVDFEFASPSGTQFATVEAGTFTGNSKTILVEDSPNSDVFPLLNGPNLYAEPGKWTMIGASVTDFSGNATIYSAAQLTAIFPSLTYTVINPGTHDSTPPEVTAGTIITPTVSLSSGGVFHASIQASDAGAGVFSASLLLNTPAGTPYYYSGSPVVAALPSPVSSGTVEISTQLFSFSGATSGTWTISGYEVCDAAVNCVDDTNPADITALFGTNSFTVTN